MDFKDYYNTLGVARSASAQEIKKAYRKLARQYHPDVNKDPAAATRFGEINEAHAVLSDPDKRTLYDRYGAAWEQVQEGAPPPPEYADFFSSSGQRANTHSQPGSGFSSFFEHLFGRAATEGDPFGDRSSGNWVMHGADVEAVITLSLEEAAAGGPREISMTDYAAGKSKTLRVNIPEGTSPGQRVRLAGQGGQVPGGGTAGDLYLVVDIQPHPRFRLQGRDLHVRLPVSPWVAVLGGRVPLKTLGGQVMVGVPPGSTSGKSVRLRGQGFPASDGPGDLYATVDIEVPADPTEQEKDLLGRLREASSFVPSA